MWSTSSSVRPAGSRQYCTRPARHAALMLDAGQPLLRHRRHKAPVADQGRRRIVRITPNAKNVHETEIPESPPALYMPKNPAQTQVGSRSRATGLAAVVAVLSKSVLVRVESSVGPCKSVPSVVIMASQREETKMSLNHTTRRQFIVQSAATGAAALALTQTPAAARAIGANDRINIGLIGCGGRGRWVMQNMVHPANANTATRRRLRHLEKTPGNLSRRGGETLRRKTKGLCRLPQAARRP